MNPLFAGQILVLAASLYLLVKGVRKLPKKAGYAVYAFVGTLTVVIILMGIYRPEWLEQSLQVTDKFAVTDTATTKGE